VSNVPRDKRRRQNLCRYAQDLRQHFAKRSHWAWSRLLDREHQTERIGVPLEDYARDYLTAEAGVERMAWVIRLLGCDCGGGSKE
jgi:hypothetical protein